MSNTKQPFKRHFSPFKLETQIDVDITYPEIKKPADHRQKRS